jgi:cell division protein FtsB
VGFELAASKNSVLPKSTWLATTQSSGLTPQQVGGWVEIARQHWLALLLGGAGILLGISGLREERGLAGIGELRGELEAIQAESFQLLQASHEARARLRALREDDHELERVARHRLKLARPGETIYVLEEPKGRGTAPSRGATAPR